MIKKDLFPLAVFNVLMVIIFTIIYIAKGNHEFLIYVGVIIFFMTLIIVSSKKVDYRKDILWGLSIWALLHMAGGGLYWNGTRFYDLILLPIIGEPYLIFKYDQFVHILGFGVSTLLMYNLLLPYLKIRKGIALGIVVVMAGLGVGAFNEIMEFIITVVVPETGVGGYINTSLDLVADLIGGIAALFYIKYRM